MDQVTNNGQPKRLRFRIFIVIAIIVVIFASFYYLNIFFQKSTKQNSKPTANVFQQYDVKKAETLLTQYVKDTIKSELLPAKIDVKQNSPINGSAQNAKNEFISSFTVNNASLSATFRYKNNSNVPNDFVVFAQSEAANQASATAALATSLTSSYFKNPYQISNCQIKENASYCENFQTFKDGKRGYGILFLNNPIKSLQIVFACFIPKESRGYELQKSCIGFQ